MAYCHTCGCWQDQDDALDTAMMCDRCGRSWAPAAPAPGDLGHRKASQDRARRAAASPASP